MKTGPKPWLKAATRVTVLMSFVLCATTCDSAETSDSAVDKRPPSESADDLDILMKRIDPARIIRAIEESPERYPVQYGVVFKVTPGMTAARLGMTPGALFLSRGGVPFNRFKLNRRLGEILWVDVHGKLHRDQVEEESIGFRMEIARNFPSWHVLHGNRNPRWDPYVTCALVMQERDPKSAAGFWELAEQSGYPADPLSNLSRMIIACLLGDAGKAASFAKDFGPLDKTPADFPQWDSDWQLVTAVTGDPSWIVAAADFFEGKFLNDEWRDQYFDISDMLEMTAGESATPPSAPPSELAARMRRTSILPDCVTQCHWTANSTRVAAMLGEMYAAAREAENQGKKDFDPVRVAQSPDFMHKSWLGPREKARDIDMRMEFTVGPINPLIQSDYMKEFHVGLANRTMHGGDKGAQVPPSARILSLRFGYDSTSEAGLSWISALVPSRMRWSKLLLRPNPFQLSGQDLFDHIPDPRPKPGEKHALRVVRVGNQAEAILDGRRLALVNVPPHLDDTGVNWFVSGVEVTITSFHVDVLN